MDVSKYTDLTQDPKVQAISREISEDPEKMAVFAKLLNVIEYDNELTERTLSAFMDSSKAKVLPKDFRKILRKYKDNSENVVYVIQGLLQDIGIELLKAHKPGTMLALRETCLSQFFDPSDMRLGVPIFDEKDQPSATMLYKFASFYAILDGMFFSQAEKDAIVNQLSNVLNMHIK